MIKVTVSGVTKPYDVFIGKGILEKAGEIISSVSKSNKIVIITDDNVDKLYSEKVINILENSGFQTFKFVFPHGEKNKTLNTISEILEFMAENNITRSDSVVALGGGITGDISGFAAASFLRGISYFQIPTTFLAAIDSSVGGKTGVNLKAGKNLAGAFYQPKAVICDTDTFKTLPDENFKEGVAEAIKYGVICDRELFDILSENSDWNTEEVIKRCVSIKAKLVSEDEFDTGHRQLLNLGHTIGHAIEKCSDYNISHGVAVGIGMAMISRGAESLGWSLENTFCEIENALKVNGLLADCDIPKKDLLETMLKDKKRKGDFITLVIPEKTGKSVLRKVPVTDIEKVLI